MNENKSVFIVEDDISLNDSIVGFLKPIGFSCKSFRSGEEILSWLKVNFEEVEKPGCLLCDIRLLGISGIDLFQQLRSTYKNMTWVTIFITGHGDVAMAVEAMQQGAFDFLSKPFDPFLLADKLNAAAALSVKRHADLNFQINHQKKIDSLTVQETNVMAMLLTDMTNKEIASSLGVSPRTIEIHRANMLKKMQVESAIELSQLHEKFQMLKSYSLNSLAK